MAVFITGGHGHIASWTAYFLVKAGEPVMLNPNFPVANIDVKHTSMNPIGTIPASVNQFVVIMRLVNDLFNLNVSIVRGDC